MSEYPMRTSNKRSEKGIAHPSGHPTSVKSEMRVGSSGSHGISFPIPNHPDHSKVRSPERK
jgi:hypothetical protein